MHFTLIASAVFALIATIGASPITAFDAVIPPNYEFRVTDWNAGCTGLNCNYQCHIEAPPRNNLPGFVARCSGKATGELNDCELVSSAGTFKPTIQASLVGQNKPGTGSGIVSKKMTVSLSFTNSDGITYNYTGFHQAQYNRGRAGGKSFRVKPSQVSATQ